MATPARRCQTPHPVLGLSLDLLGEQAMHVSANKRAPCRFWAHLKEGHSVRTACAHTARHVRSRFDVRARSLYRVAHATIGGDFRLDELHMLDQSSMGAQFCW